jgi:hypothetical protein
MAIQSFDQIISQGVRSGQIPGRTQEARDWFRNTAMKINNINEGQLMRSREALTNQIMIGKMYMFGYDPKTKKDLPYYDKFPLIFPFNRTPDGFMGINLHYLPYVLRAKLMDLLYNYVNDPKLDDKARLKITYSVLNGAATHKYIKPCVKRYLTSHIRSKFINIVPVEWDIALFLPVSNFQKASEQKVWADSTKMVRGK